MRNHAIAAALLCLFVSSLTFSQGGNSQLGGVTTDQTGALLPGVSITVTNVDTGIVNTSITNESGAYNFPSLQPGVNYSVSASLPGFQRRTVTSLNIGAATTVRQDFQLTVAAQATNVDVSIEANELLTTSAQSVGEVLTATRVRDLPIVGNDVLSLLNVMGGVVGGQGNENTTFAGVNANMVNTVRDGLSVSDGRFQSGVFTTNFINPDLVGEIRVILAPVDAEMGRGNGQVIINTRSGTNRFSGAAQWDVRNTALNPNSWNNNRQLDPITGEWSPTVPNWSNTHHYTASYGGPIIRNKTFFFVLWDQQLQYQRNVVNADVMTETARQGIFRYWSGWNSGNADSNTTFTGNNPTVASVDFAGNPLRPQYNPGTATNPPAYTGSLMCFSVFGNVKFDGSPFTQADCNGGTAVINTPWDSLRPAADSTGYIAKIMEKMPKPNNFATGDGLNQVGYRYTRTRQGNSGAAVTIGTDTNTNRKQWNIKVDQNFTSNHKLSVNWTHERNDSYNDQPTWPDGFAYFTIRTPQVVTANMTSTLSSTLLNEGRFGVRYSDANIAAPYEEKYYPNQDVVQEALKYTFNLNGYVTTANMGAGNYAFGGTTHGLIVASPGQYNGNVSKLFNYADTLSWTHGKHAFKFGGEYRATVSNGYNNIPQIPFPRILGGGGVNASNLNNASLTTGGSNGGLPATSLLSTNRGNATNMLYLLAGSVNNASMLYWIDDSGDVANGHWEDTQSLGRKFRDTVQNEMSFFFKDDWKFARNLTLNLGLRWDWYGSPYIGSGFTSVPVGRGYGLFGTGLGDPNDIFANWLQPGGVFLSGYGPNVGAAALQCTTGSSNGPFLPSSNCDPNKMTTVEFVGPNTPNPKKSAFPNDMNNFGPAVGFSWNTNFLGDNHPLTIRGGYQITYGGSGREAGGGGATSSEVILGGAPGPLSAANTIASDFGNEYLDLTDIARLVPVRPTNPVVPGGTIAISSGTANFTAVDPHRVTPYVQNFTFSASTTLTRRVTLDLRYIGTVSRKQDSSVNVNLNNLFFNKPVFEALEITRAGGDAPLFDLMFAGLNLSNAATGYGPIGTCFANATAPGAGLEGCPAGQVRQHASAHLRRSSGSLGAGQPTIQQAIANGNYNPMSALFNGNGIGISQVGTTGGLLNLPDTDPVTAGIQGPVAGAGRLLRNGCDRIAAGLYNPSLPASANNIPTQCFPENYFKINSQLGTPTLFTNGNSSNYNSLQAEVTLRPTAGISWQGTYTFSKNLGISGTATDPTDRNGDYTLLGSDRQHQFRTNGTFELPMGPNKLFLGNTSGWLARAIERWQTSIIFNVTSGAPSDIGGPTTFYANGVPDIVGPFPFKKGHVVWDGPSNASGSFHGGTYFGPPGQFVSIDDPQCTSIVDRTDTMGFNLYANNSCTINALAYANSDGTPGQIIFQTALPGRRGTLGQNVMRGIGTWTFDANLSKTFRISESKSVQVRIDTTNVLNHPTPAAPTLDSQSGNFGLITGANNVAKTGGRSFQGSLRLTF
jgi:hypothetical protein